MSKVKSSSNGGGFFPKGGTTKMFGPQHADKDRPGETSGTKAGSIGKFPKGGTTKMFGKQSASPRTPGKTGK